MAPSVVPTDPVISVRSLVKRYGDLTAVDDLDLEIQRGEIFALLGPNGAGKTTTVEILEGYRDATGGQVRVLGVDPAVQGRGVGRRLLAAGLDQLSRTGSRRVILYVDSADSVAVQMYESAGFSVAHRDVLYQPAAEELP